MLRRRARVRTEVPGPKSRELMERRREAVTSGTASLSSIFTNRAGPREDGGFVFGGGGWVVDPDGGLLAATSAAEPFVTVEADLNAADGAKGSYPRNVAGWLGVEGVSKARIEGASARAAALPNQKGSR